MKNLQYRGKGICYPISNIERATSMSIQQWKEEKTGSLSSVLSRRSFVTTMGALAVTAPMSGQSEPDTTSRETWTGPKLKVGVIGCGGRGNFIANLFQKQGGYELFAASDYFQEVADRFGEKFGIVPERRFSGLNGYKRVLETKPDLLAVLTPPYFHPEHVAAAIDAGVHVYVAKPIAVDVPGCRSIEASARLAREKKLCILVDFQTRAQPFYIEAIRRVHAGAIGDFAFGEVHYHGGRINKRLPDEGPDGRMRNWVFDQALSGDIITEQNIHALDVMNWIYRTPPLSAFGTGGRKVRVDVGDCWDHFTLHYMYPDDVGMVFSSRQFEGHGTQPEGIVCRVFGSKGVVETRYGGRVMIRGENFYRGGETRQIYVEGASNNVAAFHEAIRTGDVTNPTVAPSVQSCLITLMGRKAAYTRKLVTWDEIVNDTTRLDGRLDAMRA